MRTTLLSALAALAVSSSALVAEPITYQGRLTDASLPATGSYDMLFRVYSAATGGDLLATAPAVTVSALDGLIVATPNFPAGTFTGATVYLEISMRQAGAQFYTRMSGRQPITPSPLAFRSLNERWTPLNTSGIRTDAAITEVVINDTSPVFGDTALTVTRVASAGELGGMYVNTTGDGTPYYGWSAGHVMLAEARAEGDTGDFVLRNDDNEWVRITEGRVGIGSPASISERLRVTGNIYATDNITAAGDLVSFGDMRLTGEATAATYQYTSPQERAYSIAPEAFHAANGTDPGVFVGITGQAYLEASVGAGSIVAGVNLPHGAVVTAVDVYVIDNTDLVDVSCSLLRRMHGASAYSGMVDVASSYASPSVVVVTDTTIVNPTIDHMNYNYSFRIYCSDWQGANTALKSVRIRYTVPGPD